MNIFALPKINSYLSNMMNNNNEYINFLLSKNNLLHYLKSKNYFQIFNLPQNYHINKEKLDKTYKLLQFHFHPDKSKQNDAFECSSLISIAYKTLKDDISRIKYILKINNIQNRNDNKIDLVKLFKIQENIENSTDDMLKKIKADTLNKIKKYKENIGKEYDKKNYGKLNEIIDKINYSNSIINHINKINKNI
jgi:Fe-S protein assembly co-chaperone HscB